MCAGHYPRPGRIGALPHQPRLQAFRSPTGHQQPGKAHALRMRYMVDDLWWRPEDADHIRHRDERYPGATNIDPDWTMEAAGDRHRIVRDPDPKSSSGAVRIVGYSASAGFVITVIATGSDHAGVTAWRTNGADLQEYESRLTT